MLHLSPIARALTRATALALLLVAMAPLGADEIYRTVDENGNVTYSDSATDTSRKVELGEPTVVPAEQFVNPYGDNAFGKTPSEAGNGDATSARYQTLAIVSPENSATLRDNGGNIELAWEISPDIRKGQTGELMMDGKTYTTVSATGGVTIANADRGEHVFRLRVLNAAGREIQSSATVTVHLHRTALRR